MLLELGGLREILAASPERVVQLTGSPAAARTIAAAERLFSRVLWTEAAARPVVAGVDTLLEYARFTIGTGAVEQVRGLFLNARNELLRDELLGRGSATEAPIYPREIVRRGLELNATGLILVHNHPSGRCEASTGDRRATAALGRALASVDIALHDHLIVAGTTHFSFRAAGLL